LVYEKSAAGLVNSIILPAPTAATKGVVLTKTMFDNLLLGPTAEERGDRAHAKLARHTDAGPARGPRPSKKACPLD